MIQLVQQKGEGFIHTSPPRIVRDIAQLFKDPGAVWEGIESRTNIFYTLAHHIGAEHANKFPQRTIATFGYQTIMAWDIDKVDALRWTEYLAIISRVTGVPTDGFIVVSSGNGLHFIVNLKTPIRHAVYFSENRKYYKAILDRLTSDCRAAALPFHEWDPKVFDAARVFRMPGTVNRKLDKKTGEWRERPCEPLQIPHLMPEYDLDLNTISGLGALEEQNITPEQLVRLYPTPDFQEMVNQCEFVKWSVQHPDELHEPHAFDLFSLLGAMPDDAFAEIPMDGKIGEMTPRSLAQACFDAAAASASLARTDFDKKWDQSTKYGARKCATINETWGRCQECPHFGKIPTPLALRGAEHIGTEGTGYWVMNKNGGYVHPHYEDLAKVYKKAHPFVTTDDGRVLVFHGSYYQERTTNQIQGWVERTVRPTDPLRSVQTVEFLNKVKRVGARAKPDLDHLFDDAIRGKLNCKNGVLDLVSGEIHEASPELGFKYVLPYDYEPGKASELFLDWLSGIMQDRTELIETALDVMCYSLWPGYEDHIFTYLTGQGNNGKSTFIELIHNLVGRDNYSSVSIQQLSGNRFAPAALEGKLVNLSEESSGSELTSEHLNVIKTLCSGGTMQVEQKGKDSYSFQNKAKLIFSANKVPRFREDGTAIRRRLLVIPFDMQIPLDQIDYTIKRRLFAETPAILSMLVKRIQENITRNNGSFIVNRGGMTTAKAQSEFLTAGNMVVEWAKERVSSVAEYEDTDYIVSTEAYGDYMAWATENGLKIIENRIRFGQIMHSHVLTHARDKNDVLRVNGKPTRVYKRTKWKEKQL